MTGLKIHSSDTYSHRGLQFQVMLIKKKKKNVQYKSQTPPKIEKYISIWYYKFQLNYKRN